jgi:hypothetical protein
MKIDQHQPGPHAGSDTSIAAAADQPGPASADQAYVA